MIRAITLFIFFMCNVISAQSQFETGMEKAFTLWNENKLAEASALFERIAAAEKTNWLPLYYVALINTTEAFKTKDKQTISALLAKAQSAQDSATALSSNNAELLVMQAMINTASIVADPMTNGMTLWTPTNELYAKALIIAPNNPRVVFSKAEFEIGSAKFFGKDIKPMCAAIERSIGLFATFKPETPLSPKWGKDRAEAVLLECGK
jgi:hypothetical protein